MKLCLLLLALALVHLANAQDIGALKFQVPAPPVGTQADVFFGLTMVVDGEIVAVSASQEDSGAIDSGSVRVFDRASGAVLHALPNPSPGLSEYFGQGMAISGQQLAVGSPGDGSQGFTQAGYVYVYDLGGANPTTPATRIQNPSAAVGDFFGDEIILTNDRLVIAAPFDDLGASNAGTVYVYDWPTPSFSNPRFTLPNPTPTAGELFGYSLALSGSLLAVGAYGDDTGAKNAGVVYIYDLASATPTVPVWTLLNPTPGEEEYFGDDVAIEGTRVVVGAYNDDTSATNAGIVYIYDLASATPTVPVLTLLNPAPAAEEYFGGTVDISGTRVVVAAGWDDTAAVDAGVCYVFDLASATPTTPVHVIANPAPGASDFFSSGLALSGSRLVIGAEGDDVAATDAGIAYGYDLSGQNPTTPQATYAKPSPAIGDNFGCAVAISGARLLIGAKNEDTGASNAGSAYVFDLLGPTPTTPALTLVHPNPSVDAGFGSSVAISGSLAAVGAPGDDFGTPEAGRVYVYDLQRANPTTPAWILAQPTPAAGAKFGLAIAIDGPLVAVGVHLHAGAEDQVYVFDLTSATPTVPRWTLTRASGSAFGNSVAISGMRVLVGSPYATVGSFTFSGRAYLYDLAGPTPTTPILPLANPTPEAGSEHFGWSVGISGDGLLVGAQGARVAGVTPGSAYVYDLTGVSPDVPVVTLDHPELESSALFGRSVAISGTRLIVGAPQDDHTYADAGRAYIYDLTKPSPTTPVGSLLSPTFSAQDYLGEAVAIDGTTIVASAPNEDLVAIDKGYAYVYRPAENDFDHDGLLDLWEYARFGTIAGHGALDDSDGDGREELLELAFDRDPVVPDAGMGPQVVNEGGYLTLTLTKRTGVTYLGQSAGTPDGAAFSGATTTVLVNDATTLKVRDNFPISGGAQRFLRIKVTAAP